MSQVGPILCKICQRPILGGPKVWQSHCSGKKHISNLPPFITVNGQFNSDQVNDIDSYFQKFGAIIKSVPKVTENSASIDYVFADKKVFTDIVHKEHQINNIKLEITWIKSKTTVPTQVVRTLDPVKVVGTVPTSGTKPLPSAGSSSQNLQIQNTGPVASNRRRGKKNLTGKKGKMGDANVEESKISILNSVKEGKTFEEQINILLQKLKGNCDEIDKNRKIIYNDLTAALSPMFPLHQIHFFGSSITGLDFKGSDLDLYVANVRQRNKPEVMTLKTIRMLIYKSKKFCDLLLISGATVPIIKCIHTRTQICCDLNIRNKLSVANSELIKYYLSLDDKIRPLMIVVKFWTECYSLKKVNFLSGYALYLLVIFYLQQKPYSVPAVVDLQNNIQCDIEDGWNCAFQQLNYSNAAIKNASLTELIQGFFRFYSNFDYISQAICPYVGTPVKKICLIKRYELPRSYRNYMIQHKDIQVNAGLCIQDPFEHNRNVASSMPLQHVGRFAVLCARTAQEISNSVSGSLYSVFTKFSGPLLNECRFTIENVQSSEESRMETIELVTRFVVEILEKVICCEVSEMPKAKDDLITFDCISQHNIWDTRINILKNLQTQLPAETNEIDREIAASTCILKYFPQKVASNFLITLSFEKNSSKVEIITKTKGKHRLFFHISHFLNIKLNAWFPIFKNGQENVQTGELNSEEVLETPSGEDSKQITTEIVPNPNQVESATSSENVTKNKPQVSEDPSSESSKEMESQASSSETVEMKPVVFPNNDQNKVSTENHRSEDMVIKDEKISDQNSVCRNNFVDKQVDNVFPENMSEFQEVSVVDQADGGTVPCSETKENFVVGVDNKLEEVSKSQEEGELVEEEEEEEDVPSDFFDDFSNQDFMDGLDIVDAWDEDSGKPFELEQEVEGFKSEKAVKRPHSPIRFTSKDSSQRSSEKRMKRVSDRYDRSRSRSLTRRYIKRSGSRSRERVKLTDIRRDPEKTKRDINKDKLKCARDKEQKLVTDKLKLVETGLVPPGTEMDADISSIMKEKRLSSGNSVERLRDSKGERERKYPKRSNSREGHKSARYSRSPLVYRSRNRLDSGYRARRRTSSVDSNVSDRETWLRSSRKKTRSRSRSRSRDSPRLKMRKYEEKKKKTFLEEIRDKLNEVRSVPIVQYSHPVMSTFSPVAQTPHPVQAPHPVQTPHPISAPHAMPTPHPIPAPVPAPTQFFLQNQQNNPGMQQYDQSFFIGDTYSIGPTSNVLNQQSQNVNYNMMGGMVPVSQMQVTPVSQMSQVLTAQTASKLTVVQQNVASTVSKLSVFNETTAKPAEQKNNQMTDDIDKLFADKKISLSDFLTITAKCEVQSSSPEHLQKKIKVISRCQDAIKAMSDDRKFTTGRLSVKPSMESKNKQDVKYQSPLRRIPVVRFQFTTPTKVSEDGDGFATALDKILQKIGILKETIELNESSEMLSKLATSASTFADEEAAALTLKASLLNSKASADIGGCEECKKRKHKSFADVGSQCVDNKETASVSTQVTEEDLSPTKGLMKNDSIAYLTPAQLLGKEKEKEKETPPSPVASNDKGENKKMDKPEVTVENKKEKPKPLFKTRGGFRKSLRDRPFNDFDINEFEFYDRARPSFEFEDPREGLGPRFGTGIPLVRYPRHFAGSVPSGMIRMNQLREDEGLFTDFNQPFRGRNPGRYSGPRY